MVIENDPGAQSEAQAEIRKVPPEGLRSLLDALCDGNPDDTLALRDLVVGLGRSTFGVLLFLATLPALIPIPGLAGALSGPLVILVGLHLLVLSRKPWLPGFISRRGPHRRTIIRFDRVVAPWLRRLEHLIRPRLTAMIDHPLATIATGLQLTLLGLLLLLPIPFTNYPFAGLLLLFAFALLERDGVLLLVAWLAGIATIYTFGAVSSTVIMQIAAWLSTLA